METNKMERVKGLIRDIQDFPQKGILFRDLTTALKDGEALHEIGEALRDIYKDLGVTKVVGIEARGFIGGSMLAYELKAGFVPLRKPGKLPADTIEIHRDAIDENDVVVIHDDLLATGGTMAAAYELVKSLNPKKVYINFVVELSALNGRAAFPADAEITSLITY